MKRSSGVLLGVGLGLNVAGLLLSALWTQSLGPSVVVPIAVSVLLVLAAVRGWRELVYVLATLTLVAGVVQILTFEARRLIVGALELGAGAAFITYLIQTRTTGRDALSRT